MDFKSFRNGRKNETTEKTVENDLREEAKRYGAKSDDELLGDIFKMANEQKANGSLTDEKLRVFRENVAPMLNEEQRSRLDGVLEMLKKK